ncbi:hypothetical protein PG994_008413 [Apiospora phragmitis]|uniref:Uncharacterized protein n=1 Tax=Apiospora phragmitis TaxID=2905665 RepID=A0ABR1UTM4_9PEZI
MADSKETPPLCIDPSIWGKADSHEQNLPQHTQQHNGSDSAEQEPVLGNNRNSETFRNPRPAITPNNIISEDRETPKAQPIGNMIHPYNPNQQHLPGNHAQYLGPQSSVPAFSASSVSPASAASPSTPWGSTHSFINQPQFRPPPGFGAQRAPPGYPKPQPYVQSNHAYPPQQIGAAGYQTQQPYVQSDHAYPPQQTGAYPPHRQHHGQSAYSTPTHHHAQSAHSTPSLMNGQGSAGSSTVVAKGMPRGNPGGRRGGESVSSTASATTSATASAAPVMSDNYKGNKKLPANQSHAIPEEESCSTWIMFLPPACTVNMLLSSITYCDKVFATHINPPKLPDHPMAAAKVVFWTPEGADRLIKLARQGKFLVGPSSPKGRFDWQDDCVFVDPDVKQTGICMLVWRFSSYRCQAENAMSILKQKISDNKAVCAGVTHELNREEQELHREQQELQREKDEIQEDMETILSFDRWGHIVLNGPQHKWDEVRHKMNEVQHKMNVVQHKMDEVQHKKDELPRTEEYLWSVVNVTFGGDPLRLVATTMPLAAIPIIDHYPMADSHAGNPTAPARSDGIFPLGALNALDANMRSEQR